MIPALAQHAGWGLLQAAAPALPQLAHAATAAAASGAPAASTAAGFSSAAAPYGSAAWTGPFASAGGSQATTGDPNTHHERTAVSAFVQEAMDLIDLSPGLRRAILNPDRKFSVELPVAMDNGSVEIFIGHRVQHNNSRGPFKGGFKFHQDTDLDDIEGLASINTWKSAIVGVPFGGSKGGVAVDPTLLSARELQRLTRKLVGGMKNILGPHTDIPGPDIGTDERVMAARLEPHTDIPGPDIGTDERVMAWIFDEYSKYQGFTPAVVTGKPLHLHGSLGRDGAAGAGAVMCMREFLRKDLSTTIDKSTFVIQGFGKVGGSLARHLHEKGGRVVAIADARGATFNEGGIDVPRLMGHVYRGGSLWDYPGGTPLPSDPEFLAVPCDVLVPAALGGVINARTAPKLQCKAVVEAANAPTTFEGDKVLRERGIKVLPDVVANGGGIVVSFFEWVQNLQNFKWEEDEVERRLDRYMTDAFHDVHRAAKASGMPLRVGAYMLAVQRVAAAESHRGFF